MKSLFQSKYSRDNFTKIIRNVFAYTYKELSNPEQIIEFDTALAEKAYKLGVIELACGKEIAVYETVLAPNCNLSRNRVGVRNLLRNSWKYYDGAFIASYKPEENEWRFSFLSETKGFDDKGDYSKQVTQAKRYTYLFGTEHPCRTANERFKSLKESKKELKDIIEAFSVETLTKEFYKELFDWYEWAIDPKTGITFPNNTNIAEDDREKIDEKIIRLITRLLFVWFIKQKQLVPNNLFNVDELKKILVDFDAESKENGNYYNAILQNLFFATLNKEIKDRAFAKEEYNKREVKTLYRYQEMFIEKDEKTLLKLFHIVPFLNGGLFECLDKTVGMDGVQYAFDGFSRNAARASNGNFKHRAFIPNELFFKSEKGIIPLFEKYNFTVEENSPNEIQVALDPELLGKVFENLLGAYNPETKEIARNQSGSFYTPREIVDYMVNESLIAFLTEKKSELGIETIRKLFYEDELPKELADNHNLCVDISEALRKVKILDPACGSGAFPMGILNKMVPVLEKLDRQRSYSVYEQKLHLIEECVYGVDIQNIAVQISKLRFFISLICEQHETNVNPNDNYGIKTLPNLETKFVTADTLIGLAKREKQLNLFENPEIETTQKELLKVRNEHFYASTAYKKKALRDKDAELREKLAELLEENGDFASEKAKQLSKWNPYDQNSRSPFFDPEWMFGVKDGFDIVIGNPPYVQLQSNGGSLAKIYEKCNYKTFARTGDIYCLFYERGCQLLKQGGHLCYITSNKWMRAGYGEATRKFFAEKTNPKQLIDFGGLQVFESATVDTNILLFAKEKNTFKTQACVIKNKELKKLSDYFRQHAILISFTNSESWVVLSEIEQSIKAKIEAIGTPLKNWDINIYRGVLTGFNEAFIISGDKKNEILANCKDDTERKKTDELIRPILRG
ncbi:MAG TPA: Eco57I restriction-modification methylase domain-containing protein, partial [Bacteroidales bacterium]|nr:Eco57I restriction-modification methylase domain-containing protein [Bacteroidales bacterium]